MADMSSAIRIEILDAFTAPLNKLGFELVDVDKKLDRIGKNGALGALGKTFGERHTKMAGDLSHAAEGMGRFGDAVVGAVRKPIDDFATFDQALARVSAKTGELRGSTGFETLKGQAIELGAATQYSATQVAAAQAEFAASGRNTQEILAAMPSTLSLATAGQIDLAMATRYTNETLNQFGLGVEKTAFVQDVLARADEVSAASIEDLGDAFSYAGGTLASLNMPIQESAAYLAILADGGLKASRGGTAFQAMLTRLKSPSREATKALRELGLSQKDILELQKKVATGNLKGALTTIATKSQGLPAEKRARLLTDVFGQEGERAANILLPKVLDQGAKGLIAYLEQFKKVDGAVNRTAKIMEQSFRGALERAGGAVDALSTQLGEVMEPTARAVASSIEDASGTLGKLAKEYPDATRASIELVGTLGALSLGLKGVLMAQSAYHGGLAALGTTYKALGSTLIGSVGLVAAAGAAGYALGTWVNKTFELTEKINKLLGTGKVETQEKRGLQPAGPEVYADGTEIDLANDIVRPGADPTKWPKDLKDAIASGAKGGMPGVAAAIRQSRGRRAQQNFADSAGPDALRTDGGQQGFNAVTGKGAVEPSGFQRAAVRMLSREQVTAVEHQTGVLERAIVEQNRTTRELLEETKRANRRPALLPGRAYGTGGF